MTSRILKGKPRWAVEGSGRRQSRLEVVARKAASSLLIGGSFDKYAAADSVAFEGRPLAGCPRRATVYTLWDGQHLYIAFDVYSSKLQAVVRERDGDKLWEDDGVEFLIDPQRHYSKRFLPDDFSYHINILNAVYDDSGTRSGEPDPAWNGEARHAVKIIDDYHYQVEAAIPWQEIGQKPRQDETALGIDFCVNGKDPETGRYDYFDWCGLQRFHDPSGFGKLILAGPRKRNR